MYPKLQKVIHLIDTSTITDERKKELQVLVDFIQKKYAQEQVVKLNFICTHNSRRSQFSQVWAAVAAHHYKVPIESYSGGVQVTECNERTIASLDRFGFDIQYERETNPKYYVSFENGKTPSLLFSKLFDDEINPKDDFAAVMTCSHADENCPVVTGCEQRISLRYEDPKAYDDSPLEPAMYDCRSLEIATEMMYVFSLVK